MVIFKKCLPWKGVQDRAVHGRQYMHVQYNALFLEPLTHYIRQNREIRGNQLAERKHKLAYDVLIYLSQPTHALPQLMPALEKYGQLSGYKVNMGKTQVLS